MKIPLLSLLGLCLTLGLHAQDQASGDPSTPLRSADELNELLGPIALYPDPLISLVLPATTVPSDIVLADRFVASGGDPDTLDDKPWDASVKALTRYPDTLKWLDDNLDWTTQVGDAFTNQPDDVMNAIQALRAKAKAVGNLADTPEQTVVADDNSIRIVPAQPDYIYAPRYNPEVIYDQPAPQDDPPIYFSQPYVVGPWLGYDFDWRHHRLYRGEWHQGWDYRRDRERDGDVIVNRNTNISSNSSSVYVNRNLSNTTVWNVNNKRRIATGAGKSGGKGRAGNGIKPTGGAKLAVVKPTLIPKTAGLKPGTQPKPAFVPQGGASGKTGSPGKGFKVKSPAPGIPGGTPLPKTPAPGAKGEAFKPKGEVLKPKGEVLKPKGEEFKPKGEVLKPKGETPKPKAEIHKETPKPMVEAHKEAPKPKVEAHKEAPKPKVEAHKEAPKPKVEAHKEAPKPKVEAHKEAPKPASKDGKKKDKKDQ